MHVQAEESTPVRVGVTFLGSERCVPVYQLVMCQTYFYFIFLFFSHRRASDSMLASNYQNKRNIAASNDYVENDTSSVNQQQSDVASALCDRTSY